MRSLLEIKGQAFAFSVVQSLWRDNDGAKFLVVSKLVKVQDLANESVTHKKLLHRYGKKKKTVVL
jgi:hypothetical protein